MKEEKLEDIFEALEGHFDIEEPASGHANRFQKKLVRSGKVVTLNHVKSSWWKPLSIAASIILLFGLGIAIYNAQNTTDQNVAEISPEISNTQFYFASLVEEQVKQLEGESSPETKAIIDDTMLQLKKLEEDHSKLENDLRNGGNEKMILSAMITNFQTRIDLLQDVLARIENIKNLKNQNDENFTI